MADTFKAKYAGDAEGDVQAFGVTFEEGKSADVPNRYRQKLEGNPFFKVSGERAATHEPERSPERAPATQPPTGELAGPFEARDKSGGWWAIYDKNDNEVGKALRKDDAEAFNGMSDEDKLAFVQADLSK